MRDFSQPVLNPPELRELGSSIHQHLSPLPAVTRFLQPLVDLCRSHAVRNFLFTEDPIHVDHLKSNTLAANALTCDMTITRVAPPCFQPYPSKLYADKHQTNARYLFVPVFNDANLTYGVGVLESVGTVLPRKRDPTFSLRFDMRFVQDSTKRRLVAILDIPDTDRVLLHMSETATAKPCTIAAMFSRAHLRAIIDGQWGTMTADKLKLALQNFSHTSQKRSCPACSGVSGASCVCYVPPLPPPAHPFDMQHFKASIMQDIGSHSGVTNKIIFAGGVPVTRVALGAHSALRDLFDPQVVRDLTSWSLRKHASSRQENPLQSLLLMGPSKETMLTNSPDPGSLIDVIVSGNNHVRSDTAVVDGLEASSLETSLQSVDISAADTDTVVTQNVGHTKAIRRREERETRGLQTDEHKNSMTQAVKVERQRMPVIKEVTLQPALATEQDTFSSATTTLTASLGYNGSAPDGQHDVREIMQKLKAEERKIRNRESAHRSNMKKKKKREQIRFELEDAEERVNVLREREVALRQENIRLRRALNDVT